MNKNINHGFTLVELLVVIGIIALLAGLILPAVIGTKSKVKTVATRSQMVQLLGAINAYETDYKVFPANVNTLNCITFGATNINGYNHPLTYDTNGKQELPMNNAEIMRILTDKQPVGIMSDRFVESKTLYNVINTNGNPIITPSHYEKQITTITRNPNHIKFIELAPSQVGRAGINANGEYVDCWANPFIISFDPFGVNTVDPVYSSTGKSVIVWSFGPDGKANIDLNHRDNKDNIKSW